MLLAAIMKLKNRWGRHKVAAYWHSIGRRAWVVVCQKNLDVHGDPGGPHQYDNIQVVMQIHNQFQLRPQAPSQARCGLGWAVQT